MGSAEGATPVLSPSPTAAWTMPPEPATSHVPASPSSPRCEARAAARRGDQGGITTVATVCPGCRTSKAIDLRTVDRHPPASVFGIEARPSCYGPTFEDAIQLHTKIIVQPGRGVFL